MVVAISHHGPTSRHREDPLTCTVQYSTMYSLCIPTVSPRVTLTRAGIRLT
jgi:hypothetical protein